MRRYIVGYEGTSNRVLAQVPSSTNHTFFRDTMNTKLLAISRSSNPPNPKRLNTTFYTMPSTFKRLQSDNKKFKSSRINARVPPAFCYLLVRFSDEQP